MKGFSGCRFWELMWGFFLFGPPFQLIPSRIFNYPRHIGLIPSGMFRAFTMVSQNVGSSEEREDATYAVESIMLAREPVAIQWKTHNFGSRNIILSMDPTLYDI